MNSMKIIKYKKKKKKKKKKKEKKREHFGQIESCNELWASKINDCG